MVRWTGRQGEREKGREAPRYRPRNVNIKLTRSLFRVNEDTLFHCSFQSADQLIVEIDKTTTRSSNYPVMAVVLLDEWVDGLAAGVQDGGWMVDDG